MAQVINPERRITGQCLRMWSNWAWLHGITDRPFVPTTAA